MGLPVAIKAIKTVLQMRPPTQVILMCGKLILESSIALLHLDEALAQQNSVNNVD